MLGSYGNSLQNNELVSLSGRPRPVAASKKAKKQNSGQLIDQEWSDLPYAMMRLTAARRSWDSNRLYWRDRTVQLGEVDLNLVKTRADHHAPHYAAAYSRDELRREFTLHPSLEDDQLSWSAPGISDVSLTTGQLAEKLLARLVTFYTAGLKAPASSASPGPSS